MHHESAAAEQSAGTVLVLSKDVFFGMRIRNALQQMEYTTEFAKSESDFSAQLANTENAPVLAMIDFNNAVDWEAITSALKESPDLGTIAFGPHTDVDSFKAAKAAGMTRVVSNGTFSQELPRLIRTYANKR